VLDRLKRRGVSVTGVGKIEDIFAHRGLTRSFHTNTNYRIATAVLELVRGRVDGLIFANFILRRCSTAIGATSRLCVRPGTGLTGF